MAQIMALPSFDKTKRNFECLSLSYCKTKILGNIFRNQRRSVSHLKPGFASVEQLNSQEISDASGVTGVYDL